MRWFYVIRECYTLKCEEIPLRLLRYRGIDWMAEDWLTRRDTEELSFIGLWLWFNGQTAVLIYDWYNWVACDIPSLIHPDSIQSKRVLLSYRRISQRIYRAIECGDRGDENAAARHPPSNGAYDGCTRNTNKHNSRLHIKQSYNSICCRPRCGRDIQRVGGRQT